MKNNFPWVVGKKIYLQIRKDVARKKFNNGERIFIIPCNMRVCSNYQFCYFDNNEVKDFDKFVNGFEWYNCNNELGKYSKFFIYGGEIK